MSKTYKTYPIEISGDEEFEKLVIKDLDKITSYQLGKILLGELPNDKTIYIKSRWDKNAIKSVVAGLAFPPLGAVPAKYGPFPPTDVDCDPQTDNTFGAEFGQVKIEYNPGLWAANNKCSNQLAKRVGTNVITAGVALDEILFHELVHAYRRAKGTYTGANIKDVALGNGTIISYGNFEEFISILVTNIYMSEKGSASFRADHSNKFTTLSPNLSTSSGFLSVPEFSQWVADFKKSDPLLCSKIKNSTANFNPLS